MLVFLALSIYSALALTNLEAEGLVRFGFCTRAVASNSCDWTSNCVGVYCNPNGALTSINYTPKNSDSYAFRGLSSEFTDYFENISALYVDDRQLSPPVRWSLNNMAARLRKIDTFLIRSQPGGLYGTLPQRFTSTYLGGFLIDAELEGTIPSGIFSGMADPVITLINHKLVGTIPSALLNIAGTRMELQSAKGGLVGALPRTFSCKVSTGYLTGIGENGGLFCECNTHCTPNQTTGVNVCYDYTDPTNILDACATYPALPNCVNSKLTMRYGLLCYDACDAGCPVGTACGVQFEQGTPSFACIDVVVETVTTPTTYPSGESSTAPIYATLSTLLSLVL